MCADAAGFTEHVLPTDQYDQTALPVIQSRMMYGGARLAALIESIYGDASLGASIYTAPETVFSFLN